jgi:hypothetical protein
MVGDGRLQTETLLDGLDVVCRQNGNVAAATRTRSRLQMKPPPTQDCFGNPENNSFIAFGQSPAHDAVSGS